MVLLGSFQKIVLVIAIVILILILVLIASMKATNKAADWPPNISSCPDWWIEDGSGSCVNVKDLGSCSKHEDKAHQEMNFNLSQFTGSNGNCNKYNWATKCKVTWDGITYGMPNPCD